jgi:hypothetical protein
LKIIGAFLIFIALYGFQEAFTVANVSWFIIGVFLVAINEWVLLVQYICKAKQ